MKRVMILDSDYPSQDNLYGDVFVHTRAKAYQKSIIVQVVSFFNSKPDYEYEGISVKHALGLDELFVLYKNFKPDAIFIHFYNRKLFQFINEIDVPVVIWVHGYEALGWYRRLFNYTLYEIIRNIHSIIIPNIRQMVGFRNLIMFSNKNKRVRFVFVSKWMKKVAEVDSFNKIENYSVIPNPINTQLFDFHVKDVEQRKKILIIRSFSSNKYANDISVNAILILSKMPFFSELKFSIYGKGRYFKTLTNPLKPFDNVLLNETFLDNSAIPNIHKQYGVFLCPTRQDAQGVSMCEAMSSGLVPITSNCTAIPEFVQANKSGFLTSSAKEVAASIVKLYNEPLLFESMSKAASIYVNKKCSFDKTIEKELSILNFE